MTIKKRLFALGIAVIRCSARLFGKNNQDLILSNMVEELPPVFSQDTPHGKINFYCLGEIPLYRAETLLTKEPETIEWIESFKAGETLWDIGANIGCYSLYAAKKGISVSSFEPSAANFFLLQKNILYNHLDEKIRGFCLAFNDVSEIGFLNMSTIQMGGSINSFGDAVDKIKFMDDSFDVKFKQGMVSFSIDDFISIYQVLLPNHIKIDVDGIENKIIKGAKNSLKSSEIRSILIELDFSQGVYNQEIIRILEESGFTLASKKHAASFNSGKFSSIYNCVFKKV